MKRLMIFSVLIVVCTLHSYSQADSTQGIAFEQGASWREVLQQAKKENKFVLVDCYASWCGPCRLMDKEVYINDSVGSYVNAHYISVRLQMDSTDEDNAGIRALYGVANSFQKKYHVFEYPTFLFFSPDGQLLHRESGGRSISSFLDLTKAVLDPKQQYLALLANYQLSEKDYSLMPALIKAARKMREDSLAKQAFREYLNNYFDKLSDSALLIKENIVFLGENSIFLFPGDKVFQTYYKSRLLVDSLMHHHGYANDDINFVIYRNLLLEDIGKCIKAGRSPHWNRLKKTIAKEFDGKLAKSNVLKAKIYYYKAIKKWDTYCKYYIEEQQENGITKMKAGSSALLALDNCTWEVFEYSENKRDLKEVLNWINLAIKMSPKPDPDVMDTKANLLYKLGRKEEGLALEQQVCQLAPKDKDIQQNYSKMERGIPTWVN